jgi:hypothetical protein
VFVLCFVPVRKKGWAKKKQQKPRVRKSGGQTFWKDNIVHDTVVGLIKAKFGLCAGETANLSHDGKHKKFNSHVGGIGCLKHERPNDSVKKGESD